MPYNAVIATKPISNVREETGGKNSKEVKSQGIHQQNCRIAELVSRKALAAGDCLKNKKRTTRG